MDRGDRGDEERDPFEDLDQFFAPLEEVDEEDDLPAAEPPAAEPPAADVDEEDAVGALEDLEDLEVTIDLPDEEEAEEEVPAEEAPPLTAGEIEEPAAAGSTTSEIDLESAQTGTGEWDRLRAETLGGEPPVADDVDQLAPPPAPPPTAEPDLPGLASDVEGLEVEADDQAAAASEFADVGTTAMPPAGPAQEAEAAAEHFATGLRESPEDIERELLSDLGDEGTAEPVRIEPTPPIATEAPTWQEGGERVITEEPGGDGAPPTAARNVPAALVSGVLLGAAVLALLAINKGAFMVLATAAILLAQAELYAVMRTRGLQPATLLGLVCGGFTVIGAYLHGETAAMLGPVLATGLTVPWYIAAPASSRKHTTANVAATVLGVVYVPFLASFAMLLLRVPGDSGTYMFLAMLVLTVLYDVSAYAVGTVWGRRPLAPTVSPQKSWEGAIGATLIILLVALGVIPNFVPFDGEGGAGMAVGLALVIAIMAPLGDLVESAFKRDLGVKDMGSLLPGHGGVLDRIDAILFAAPAAYFFLRIVLT